ncbi:MAG: Gfo/Idh/MocA family oxidoreductase [bacterium]|nr:Gfo/Idh/MocA family oxidoreductase [bacterium]
MTRPSRRNWMLSTATTGLSALAYQRVAKSAVGKSKLSIGMIGCGGRARGLQKSFANEADLGWACDPDAQQLAAFQQAAGQHAAPATSSDLRRVLDDKRIDAVVIATPDHWHAPAAILACQAHKHVYVEKPCSHNLLEGAWLLEAAAQNQVVIQHGTQSRSNPHIAGAIQLLHDGLIGEVLVCKAWNVQRRRNIGHARPSTPPAHVDYDTWVGPAEFVPFQSNRFHYDWHWWHNFGTGDIGNDGTHEIDIARWGLGVHGLPSMVTAMGGKFYFDDDQQFPDTATCAFQWPGKNSEQAAKQLIFEMRIWSKNYPHNVDTGIEFYGTQGMLFVSKRGKLSVWDEDNRPLRDIKPAEVSMAASHQLDFLESIEQTRVPVANMVEAHDSCSLVHLANVSLRVGRSLQIDTKSGTVVGDKTASTLLGRSYREGGHWAIPAQA